MCQHYDSTRCHKHKSYKKTLHCKKIDDLVKKCTKDQFESFFHLLVLVLSLTLYALLKLVRTPWPKPANRLTIVGPAGVRYDSVHEAARDYIQNWLPDWRTKHYMLPPIFEYKFTEPSGASSGAVKQVGPDCEDRSMDVVFHAVNRFMEKYEIPGVVFSSFTMRKREELLERFLPFMTGPDWIDQYAHIECDLLIVSPKMGFVAFEIKGTESSRARTVKKNLQKAAAAQTSSKLIRRFLDVILQHADMNANSFPVRRVVALPFQMRAKLDSGQNLSHLLANAEAESGVDACLFSEDFSSKKSTNDGLYCCLKRFLIPNVNCQRLIQDGASTKLMHTLITIWALRMTGSNCELDHSVASNALAIAKTDERIKGQKLWEGKEKGRNRSAANLEERGTDGPKTAIIPCAPASVMMTDPGNRIFFITPEQKKVLDGPPIQLIHGPAGSGKSVLIMIKAAQLIKDGNCVTICACQRMVDSYMLWKERNGFTDEQCEVYNSYKTASLLEPLKSESAYDQIKEAMDSLATELRKSSVLSPSQSCVVEVKRITSGLPNPTRSDDNSVPKTQFSGRSVFLDDAVYWITGFDLYALLFLAFHTTHGHHLWIAGDALQTYRALRAEFVWQNFYSLVSLAALVLGELPSEEAGTLSVLRSVQRCSTHVFNAWLDQCNDIMAQGDGWSFAKELYHKVVPGHHFVGPAVINRKVKEMEDAVKFVSDEVANLIKAGTQPHDIAILCDYELRRVFLQELLEEENRRVAYCHVKGQLNGTDAVAVGGCTGAVSLEWPIVFVLYPSSTNWRGELPMAMSRARTKLTVVEVTNVPDLFLDEEARKLALKIRSEQCATEMLTNS